MLRLRLFVTNSLFFQRGVEHHKLSDNDSLLLRYILHIWPVATFNLTIDA
jgi:hypothetical protein